MPHSTVQYNYNSLTDAAAITATAVAPHSHSPFSLHNYRYFHRHRFSSDFSVDEADDEAAAAAAASHSSTPAALKFLIFRDPSPLELSRLDDWRNYFLPFFFLALAALSGVAFILAVSRNAVDVFEFDEQNGNSEAVVTVASADAGASPSRDFLYSRSFCFSRSLALSTSLTGGGILIILLGFFYCFSVVGQLILSNSSVSHSSRFAVFLYILFASIPYFLLRFFGSIVLLFFSALALLEPSNSDCIEIARWSFVVEGFAIALWNIGAAAMRVKQFNSEQ